ncbi:MAG: hypothetical protein U0797_02765 [Gemmataceae bacterium]
MVRLLVLLAARRRVAVGTGCANWEAKANAPADQRQRHDRGLASTDGQSKNSTFSPPDR